MQEKLLSYWGPTNSSYSYIQYVHRGFHTPDELFGKKHGTVQNKSTSILHTINRGGHVLHCFISHHRGWVWWGSKYNQFIKKKKKSYDVHFLFCVLFRHRTSELASWCNGVREGSGVYRRWPRHVHQWTVSNTVSQLMNQSIAAS